MAWSAYRSAWGKNVGGANKPTEPPVVLQSGYRSLLWFQGGGSGKPLSHGDYAGPRSLLAFWMGGAAFHYIPGWIDKGEFAIAEGGEGIGKLARERHGYPINDEEIFEFLQAWTMWNDIE